MTNSTQAVTGTLTQDGFGNTVASTGSSSSPYMYAATSGYRNDGDAGLSHVGARYYDAQTGTFTSRDTYLDQKPYLYCEHDPVNSVDPSGHQSMTQYIDEGSRWGDTGAHWGGLFGGAIGGEVLPIITPIVGGLGGMIGGMAGEVAHSIMHPWQGAHDITPEQNRQFGKDFPKWTIEGAKDGVLVGAVIWLYRKFNPEPVK